MTSFKPDLAHNVRRHFIGHNDLEKAYEMGLIRLEDLEHGAAYEGTCRNASVARWDADLQRFIYTRTKFGSSFFEEINHPANDDGFDLFFAVNKIS